jgi:hypothetical protein
LHFSYFHFVGILPPEKEKRATSYYQLFIYQYREIHFPQHLTFTESKWNGLKKKLFVSLIHPICNVPRPVIIPFIVR